MIIRAVAKKTVSYDGVYYKKGDKFDIKKSHFKLLQTLGKVEKAEPVKPKPEPKAKAKAPARKSSSTSTNRRASSTQKKDEVDKDDDKSESSSTASKGSYSRKDMRAED